MKFTLLVDILLLYNLNLHKDIFFLFIIIITIAFELKQIKLFMCMNM